MEAGGEEPFISLKCLLPIWMYPFYLEDCCPYTWCIYPDGFSRSASFVIMIALIGNFCRSNLSITSVVHGFLKTVDCMDNRKEGPLRSS